MIANRYPQTLRTARSGSAGLDLQALSTFLLLGVGAAGAVLVDRSIAPALLDIGLLTVMFSLLWISGLTDSFERRAFCLFFAVGSAMAVVAAFYAVILSDYMQNNLDVAYFLDNVRAGRSQTASWQDLITTENFGALLIWQLAYDGLSVLGFERQPFIGIAVNNLLVSLAGLAGIKTIHVLSGGSFVTKRQFVRLFSLCGMMWLFASIHLRDAAILLSVSLLTTWWVIALARPTTLKVAGVVVISALSPRLFQSLRTELWFAPIGMALAGLASLLVGRLFRRGLLIGTISSMLFLLPIVTTAYFITESDLSGSLAQGRETYDTLSGVESDASSLGNTLVVSRGPILRGLLGAPYTLLSPIPAWSGFQVRSAYHLFKSLNAIFMYCVIPLFVLGAVRAFVRPDSRSAPEFFLLGIWIAFTLAVAYTSLEGRHLGAFVVSFLAIASLPDLSEPMDRRRYKRLLAVVFIGAAAVHVLWVALKL